MADFRDDKCPCGRPWSKCPWNIFSAYRVPLAAPPERRPMNRTQAVPGRKRKAGVGRTPKAGPHASFESRN